MIQGNYVLRFFRCNLKEEAGWWYSLDILSVGECFYLLRNLQFIYLLASVWIRRGSCEFIKYSGGPVKRNLCVRLLWDTGKQTRTASRGSVKCYSVLTGKKATQKFHLVKEACLCIKLSWDIFSLSLSAFSICFPPFCVRHGQGQLGDNIWIASPPSNDSTVHGWYSVMRSHNHFIPHWSLNDIRTHIILSLAA